MMLKRCCGVSHRSILVGLTTIVVTNCAGLTGNKRKQKVWRRNRKVRLADSLGSYASGEKFPRHSVAVCGQHCESGIELAEMGATTMLHDAR
jgi:hypothetical protein